jgi:hypothetical protein
VAPKRSAGSGPILPHHREYKAAMTRARKMLEAALEDAKPKRGRPKGGPGKQALAIVLDHEISNQEPAA